MQSTIDNYVGCLLGGAVGDALGAPIEFMSLAEIRETYGPQGITTYVEHRGEKGEFTDDTQMTLFTAEALMRAYVRELEKGIGGALNSIAYMSYLRWLQTQQTAWKVVPEHKAQSSGWLLAQKSLYKRRAPGINCLNALQSGIKGEVSNPINDSKGCGTIMRMAPVGLMIPDPERAFNTGCDLAALTHGHPSGYLSAGFFASVIAYLVQGTDLYPAIENSVVILKTWKQHEETLQAVNKALALFKENKSKSKRDSIMLEELGGAWVAEEALAISLFCALLFEADFKKGVLFSVNHSGDSDSTGSITGNILGLLHGSDTIPKQWVNNLMDHELVMQVGADLYNIQTEDYEKNADQWWQKYPGG